MNNWKYSEHCHCNQCNQKRNKDAEFLEEWTRNYVNEINSFLKGEWSPIDYLMFSLTLIEYALTITVVYLIFKYLIIG